MSKYSFELKMTIIHEYLKGKGGYPYLAKKYGIKSMGQIRDWVKSYQEFGKEGLLRKRQNQSYSGQFKMDALTNVCRTYVADLKLVAMTTKTDTRDMQAYWWKQLANAQECLLKSPSDLAAGSNKQVALENIQRLQTVERERPDLTFYYVIYADSVKELRRNERVLKQKASVYRLKPLNKAEITAFLYRCNNINDE